MRGRHSIDATLIALIGLAVATLIVSQKLGNTWLSNTAVLVLAALKGRAILLDFLGLRFSAQIWRVLVTTWVIAVVSFAWVVFVVRLFA